MMLVSELWTQQGSFFVMDHEDNCKDVQISHTTSLGPQIFGSRQEGGLGLQEMQVRGGGLKKDAIRRGCVDFFWNNPMC